MNTNIRISIFVILVIAILAFLAMSRNYEPQTVNEVATSTPITSTTKYLQYENSSQGISLNYPEGYTVDDSYTYQGLGPAKSISGVKFTIPQSMTTGTNLSSDSYVSIEQLPLGTSCTADMFLDMALAGTMHTVSDNGMNYSVVSSTDAGAGNRYEQTVYAFTGPSSCVAVRYYMHYGVIENYPAGQVAEFNKTNLLSQFDVVRRSLTVKSVSTTPKVTYMNATADMIVVTSPALGAIVGKTFTVSGKARGGWYFEASFPIVVKDAKGNVLAQGPAKATSDWMTSNFVPFTMNVKITGNYSGPATITLKNDNPSGLPENDKSISFPITIK